MTSVNALPPGGTNDQRKVATAINQILQGKTNNTLTITLAANADNTEVKDNRIGSESTILFTPRSASAAAISASVYVISKSKGMAIIGHANDAAADKMFDLAIIG